MKLSVGDRVVHPKHGAGKITGIEQLELVEGFEHYYVIEIGDNGLVVRVPIRSMEELGVRPVMSASRLDRVLDTLHSAPDRLSTNFKTRQARIKEKLRSNRPVKIAEVIRDLAWRKQESHLSPTDARLLSHGQEMLATEIALVTNAELSDARQMIRMALNDSDDGDGDEEESSTPHEQVLQTIRSNLLVTP
jgi:CarD family transcriptional regulator